MNNTITEEFKIRFYETGKDLKLNIISILNYFNEIAQKAGDYYAVKKDIYKEDSLAWIILNWDIEVKRYPAYPEKINVITVAKAINTFYAYREFYILDSEKRELASGRSKWILLDFITRRPSRAKEYMYELYGVAQNSSTIEIRIPAPHTAVDYESEFAVRRSDIDLFEHVNNVVYAEWVLESLPPEKITPSVAELRRTCSRKCGGILRSKLQKGVNNGRYIHGKAEERYPLEFRHASERVRIRDGKVCQGCGLKSEDHEMKGQHVELHVHHIDYNKENNSETNLITLCRFCHGAMHGGVKSRAEWTKTLSLKLSLRNLQSMCTT